MAAAKLKDGDAKGAIRLLCSDDRLAIQDAVTFAELSRLHPPAPADRRPAPSTDVPPLRVIRQLTSKQPFRRFQTGQQQVQMV
jgi:hypothetical protein